jgi:hypothetical protein
MLRILLIPFLIPFLGFSQQKKPDSSFINEIVRKIDKLSKTSSRSFINTKVIKNKKVKETWQHFDNKQLARLIINYTIDSTDYSEEYYFKDGLLIYASENEISRFPSLRLDAYSLWGGGFYFSNGKLIDHVTLGHGKSESDDWDPEKEILQRLEKRKKELTSLK